MSDNRNDIRVADEVAAARQEWQRPEVRTVSAGEAETLLVGTNADIVFS